MFYAHKAIELADKCNEKNETYQRLFANAMEKIEQSARFGSYQTTIAVTEHEHLKTFLIKELQKNGFHGMEAGCGARRDHRRVVNKHGQNSEKNILFKVLH